MTRCCDQDYGGSHYHCPQCNAITSMMGHGTAYCKVTQASTFFHTCCPGDCELDDPARIEAEIAFWKALEKTNDRDYDMIVSDSEKKLKIALDRQQAKSV